MKHDATIKTVTEVGLAVDENLRILKHVIEPEHKTGQEKRICVVTGTHGDELEGQYVCYELNCLMDERYIKLSHGRDFMDATVDRGCFLGTASQQQTILIKVEEK